MAVKFTESFRKGNIFTKLSILIPGLGNLVGKQIIKGIMYIAIEAAFVCFMIMKGINCLAMLPGLGSRPQQEVWNEKLGIYEYVAGDNSLLILLYGIATIFMIIAYIIVAAGAVKSSYKLELLKEKGKHINTFAEDVKSLFNENLHKLLLTLPVSGVLIFTILPLIFMISMAFTNYSKVNNHLVLFDWVGLENFKQIFDSGSMIGQSFWSVFGWTIVWAVFATFLNYIFGILVALLINRKGTKFKAFWRFIFILSIAIPQFVSLLIVRSMLAQDGIINVVLKNAGWITKSLPFFTNATWARITVIVVNLWIGIPYTILQVTTTFTANINNFNIVYLLTKGDPVMAGATAGKTDLLVTWLYKMTIDYQYYNLGAVIGIMTFIFLAIGSLLVYRRTKAYKDEEGFQ